MDQLVAWILFAFIIGAVLGGYTVHRLTAGGVRGAPTRSTPPRQRGLHWWSRQDVEVSAPEPQVSRVVMVSNWNDTTAVTSDHRLSFNFAQPDGTRRTLTFSRHQVEKFLRSGDSGPTRTGYRGDNNDYTMLLRVAKAYHWCVPE